MKTINWIEQWELHAPNFKEGFSSVFLKDYGGPDTSFKMEPGPGFGDLSHPTTRIMLYLMPKQIEHSTVLDIGCGSGVLSLAAKMRGAAWVFGIDREEEAISHARQNSRCNGFSDLFFSKTLPFLSFVKPPLILMNMISSEQKVAWESLPQLHCIEKKMIVSGVYFEQREEYLREVIPHYGVVVEEKSLDGWLGWVIERKS